MCIAFKLFDVDATTRFHFNGTIICRTPLEGSFVQMLAVYEDDLTSDDLLGATTNFVRTETGMAFSIDVTDDGDGAYDTDYEISFLIKHNCTHNGETIETRVEVKSFPVVNGDLYHTEHVNLSRFLDNCILKN
ncbi:ZP domain-containing protein [Caenorhabditis elegans]|uniref:ZP domain-containing protein n=1 Tax=Caenorhabditis elegans TaxID=6239 RepID=Q9N322_CAEEL|nr:ZP domain-containing protein [Caenorhabditis elegans]CCD71146.2 ZP domain-containing protein [Caenorhabditis elegans]|eukprot:NP_501466.2 Uncharacterized protein CELE_Y59H11AR.3 [Caenorhabditis elegans]